MGPPATCHSNGILLAGRWSPDIVCLLRIAHGGIEPFTDLSVLVKCLCDHFRKINTF